MIIKKIKEYGQKSPRLKIDINKGDGFNPGEDVVIMTAKEHDDIKSKLFDFNALEKENQLLKNQEQNLKQIVEDVTTPIHEDYKKQLQIKDNQIEQLQMQLNTLQKVCTQFNVDVMSLGLKDRVFKGKLKELSHDFNNRIWITGKDSELAEVDRPGIPGADGKK